MRNILSIVHCVLLFIVMVFCCVGTGVNWLIKKDASGGRDLKYYLYGARLDGDSLKRYNEANGQCPAFADRFHAAYAFAIIASIVAGIAFFLAVATLFLRRFERALKVTTLGLAIFAFICNLITWALAATLYRHRFCGASLTPNQAGVDLAAGIFLFIVAWVLLFIAIPIAVINTCFLRQLDEQAPAAKAVTV